MENPLKGGYGGPQPLGKILGTKKDLTEKIFGSREEPEEVEEVEEEEIEGEEEETD